MVSVFRPNSDWQQEKKILHKQCGYLWLHSNQKNYPENVSAEIKKIVEKAKSDGYTNLSFEREVSLDEYDNERDSYIGLWGYIEETNEEYNKRLEWMENSWKREWDEYQRKKKFFETEYGKAVLVFIGVISPPNEK